MDKLNKEPIPTDRREGSFTHLYLAKVPSESEVLSLGYPSRDVEIQGIRNERVKREKYYAFRLLERAARESLGVTLEELAPTRSECGRWYSAICDFSLSHSGEFIAVAISSHRVGVDVQSFTLPSSPSFPERTLNPLELSEYYSLPEAERGGYLMSAWCGKEAVFKALGKNSFIPSEIDTNNPEQTAGEGFRNYRLISDCFEISGEKIILSLFCTAKCDPCLLHPVEL